MCECCSETEISSQKTAEHFCLCSDRPPAKERGVRFHPGIMPASTFVKGSKVRSNRTDARVSERGQHRYKTQLLSWLKHRKTDPCTYFHKQNVSIIIPCSCFLAPLQEQRRKELQLLQHRFFFDDRANKSTGLWQTALHRILSFFPSSTWQVSHRAFFFLSLSLFQDYISLCLIISFQLHTMKDYDAAAARTAGSVPSKIFLLMLLTRTSVYASA